MDGKAALVTFLAIVVPCALVLWEWCKSDSPIITKTKTTTYRRSSPPEGTDK